MFSYKSLCEQYGKEEVDKWLNDTARNVINKHYAEKAKRKI